MDAWASAFVDKPAIDERGSGFLEMRQQLPQNTAIHPRERRLLKIRNQRLSICAQYSDGVFLI
jgi:hypothetical protein